MNKQDNREANNQSAQTESLADLALTTEQAEETKAGTGFNAYNMSFQGGVRVASGE
jgi:hypothetical protein